MTNRRRLQNLLSNPLVALLIVGLIVALVIVFMRSSSSGSSYFSQGVYINDVDMSCYTKEEGETRLTAWASSLVNQTYTLCYGSSQWSFTPADVGASFNTKEILQNAWNLGHVGSVSDMNAAQQQLRSEPQRFYVSFTYNESKLDAYIEKIYNALYIAPVDADIVLTATQPVIVSDSKDGQELDSESLRNTLVLP